MPLNGTLAQIMNSTKIKWKRFYFAIVISTAVSAQILAMFHYWNGPYGLSLEVLPYTPFLALTYLMFMLPTAFAVGIPFVIALNRLGWFNGIVVVAIGTIAGVAWALPALIYKSRSYDLAMFFGLGGFIASLLFWVIYSRANKQINKDTQLNAMH